MTRTRDHTTSTRPATGRPPRSPAKAQRPRHDRGRIEAGTTDAGTGTTATVGSLLGVWAHPDDEAYMSAGLMGQVRAAGHRVVVATATRGEHGTDDPDSWPPDRLGILREQEMAASLAAVDVREHHWLGHIDGTLPQVSPDRGIAQVADLIARIRPDTILTFGPDGMTGHPDHRVISQWVTAAWEGTGRAARLWYATVTDEFHRTWGEVNEDVKFFYPESEPPSDRTEDLAYVLHCDARLLDGKFAALQAHTSQTAGLIRRLGTSTYRQWWSTEYFADAALRPVGVIGDFRSSSRP